MSYKPFTTRYKVKVYDEKDVDKVIKTFDLDLKPNTQYDVLGQFFIREPLYYIKAWLEDSHKNADMGAYIYIYYPNTFAGWDWGNCKSTHCASYELIKLKNKKKLWKKN